MEAGPRAGAKRPRGVVFMLLMAIAARAVAGVGAWGFRMLIGLVHNLGFLGRFAFEYNVVPAAVLARAVATTDEISWPDRVNSNEKDP